jgi:hypothetical protein
MSTFRVRMRQGIGRDSDGSLDTVSQLTGSITAASNASPIVITSAAHGLSTGTRVTVQSVGGNTNANNDWIITVVDVNNFSLNGSSGNSAYTSGGVWKVDSAQRTMFAMGPNKINRKLTDGQVFTDCNYWKQFTYPTVPYNQAFIEVVTDDGSPYVAGQQSTFIHTYSLTVTGGTTTTTGYQLVNFLGTDGGPAVWCTITPVASVQVRVNGNATSDFTVTGGTTYSFTIGEMLINTLQIANSASGSTTCVVQGGILVNCNS